MTQAPRAYYIKLGRAGCWESDALATNKLRFGWSNQSVDDIHARRWDLIQRQLAEEQPGKPQVVTTDLNRLRDIVESTSDDVWVSFHGGKLWWTQLTGAGAEQDAISKFRTTKPWQCTSAGGRLLVAHELPGRIAQLQGFRGTVCRVADAALLARVLEDRESPAAQAIRSARLVLESALASAIRELHWKDFETLVDLVFRQAGWRRESILGQQVKGFDLALREPLTQRRVLVQVKSRAGRAEVDEVLGQFDASDFERTYFVVHSPDPGFDAGEWPEHFEWVGPERLAALSLDAGLADWLRDKMA